MRRYSSRTLLSRLQRCSMGLTVACVPVGLVVALVAVACSSDGGTSPGGCTGTCLVTNQSDLSVVHVYLRPCTNAL